MSKIRIVQTIAVGIIFAAFVFVACSIPVPQIPTTTTTTTVVETCTPNGCLIPPATIERGN